MPETDKPSTPRRRGRPRVGEGEGGPHEGSKQATTTPGIDHEVRLGRLAEKLAASKNELRRIALDRLLADYRAGALDLSKLEKVKGAPKQTQWIPGPGHVEELRTIRQATGWAGADVLRRAVEDLLQAEGIGPVGPPKES
ncbi:hypothetical protein [Pseudonocardia sp. T1-2H]|uniref:hypothetical protein n=1 Tax=Pseudonocardia sp. T1-2H TaxID=3128899 RepID=UPI0031014600